MTEKHTPRPWNQEAIYCLLRFAAKNRGPWDDSWIWSDDSDMPDEDDASLIAAAPDLLEALKQAVDWIEDDRFDDDYIGEQWYHDACAAIAKARGDDDEV